MFWVRQHRHERGYRGRGSSLFGFEPLEARRVLAGPDEPPDELVDIARFDSESELETFLLKDALRKYEPLFGQPTWSGPWVLLDAFTDGVPRTTEDVALAPPDHSDTNTQVAGVDEDDLVETDGQYLYILSGQELVIVNAWSAEQQKPPEDLPIESRFEITGQPIGQFLNGDRLTILSHVYSDVWYPEPVWWGRPMLFDMAMRIPVGQPEVRVTVLDVSDRQNPVLVQATEMEGSYVDSRAIGNLVYVATSASFGLPAPEVLCDEPTPVDGGNDVVVDDRARAAPDGIWFPPDSSCVYETREQYLVRIAGNVLDLALPHASIFDADGQEVHSGRMYSATDLYHPVSKEYPNLIGVSVFDVSEQTPDIPVSTGVPTTYSTNLYASLNSFYLTNPDWGAGWNRGEATSILKLDKVNDRPGLDLTAVGMVPGRVLNSFSMDEHEQDGIEYFRVATTSGWGDQSRSHVYVLSPDSGDGKRLSIIGETEPLAPGEQIFSVRFVDTTGYVVTFRQVDPLFTIDLSDPENPQVGGELHITGFSNYMQPIRDDFLIGLGRDADPNTGRANALQISLFDVGDLNKPELAARYKFNVPDWAWSEALDDHHAVGYYPEYQVLAIPVSNGEGWVAVDRNRDGLADIQTYRPRTDLYVFRLDLPEDEAGTVRTAQIDFLGTITDDAQLRRSVRIATYLYSISDNSVTVHPILDPGTEVGHVHFGQEDVGVPVFTADEQNVNVQVAMETPARTPPQPVRIAVGSTGWATEVVKNLQSQTDSPASQDSATILPLVGIDQIKVTFNEDVLVDLADLRLTSQSRVRYTIRDFTYDVDTATAVWTLEQPIGADTLTLGLRSGIVDLTGNRLDGNADGRAGGLFSYRIQVLPGDVDGDGRVDLADVAAANTGLGARIGDAIYAMDRDVDGNGRIDEADLAAIRSRAGSMVSGFVPPAMGDANGDGRFDSQDLIQILQIGKYRTGQYATYAEGDWNRDGVFDESDLVTAFKEGLYLNDVAAAVAATRLKK